MREFLAFFATFASGAILTGLLAYSLEHQELARHHTDEIADVHGGIIAVTNSGYAIPSKPTKLAQLQGG
jgi:hypothetical protein